MRNNTVKIIPINKSSTGIATPGPKYADADVIESIKNITEIKKIICI